MKPNRDISRELRNVSLFIAVIAVLSGFSAVLATKEEPAVTPAAEHATAVHQDPSLAGLSVADDAEADGTVELYN